MMVRKFIWFTPLVEDRWFDRGALRDGAAPPRKHHAVTPLSRGPRRGSPLTRPRPAQERRRGVDRPTVVQPEDLYERARRDVLRRVARGTPFAGRSCWRSQSVRSILSPLMRRRRPHDRPLLSDDALPAPAAMTQHRRRAARVRRRPLDSPAE